MMTEKIGFDVRLQRLDLRSLISAVVELIHAIKQTSLLTGTQL